MTESGTVHVLYGSETGTAEDVAEKLCSLLALAGVESEMRALDEVAFSTLLAPPPAPAPPQTCIFVVSTTGDGKPPANMRQCWQYLLQRRLASNALASIRFSVFGLGDSSYDKYNAAARFVLYCIALQCYIINIQCIYY
jgi:sulfite reductase alpha subunit-like flavoprotein